MIDLMEFAYEATDADGSLIEGTLTADDADGALDQIRDAGYVPLRLVPDLPEADAMAGEVEDVPAPVERHELRGTVREAPPRPRPDEFEWTAQNDLPDRLEPAAPPRSVPFGVTYPFTDPLAATGLRIAAVAIVVSVVFLFFNVWAAIFPLAFLAIGVAMGSAGWKSATKRLRAWKHGVAAPARIVWIGQDTSYKVNGQSPWMMKYEFIAGDDPVTGTRKSFNEAITELRRDERIWIVYLPEDPTISAEWPPIA